MLTGKFRGGLGQEIRIENESPTPIVMSFMAERTMYPAPGLAGGRAGGRALGYVLPKKHTG